MRILFGGHSLADPRGGGELSARTLLAELVRSHEVEAVCVGREARDYVFGGVRCRDHRVSGWPAPAGVPFHLAAMLVEARFRQTLARHVREASPDLVLLQQPGCLDPRDLPPQTKLIVFLRSLVCYGAGDPNPRRWRRIAGGAFRVARFHANRRLLARADLLVSNSRFLQHALRSRAGLSSEVVTPFIDTAALRTPAAGEVRDALTFVGLDEWKGASIVLRLAEALPERHFLFLAGARDSARVRARAGRLGNVAYEGWTEEMGRVFARTRILLMPSIWEEPFGRLPVEAGACGVPTLASARGGLREAVGDGGMLIDPVEDLALWIRCIEQLDDPARYASLAAAARRHATALGLDVTLKRFGDPGATRAGDGAVDPVNASRGRARRVSRAAASPAQVPWRGAAGASVCRNAASSAAR